MHWLKYGGGVAFMGNTQQLLAAVLKINSEGDDPSQRVSVLKTNYKRYFNLQLKFSATVLMT